MSKRYVIAGTPLEYDDFYEAYDSSINGYGDTPIIDRLVNGFCVCSLKFFSSKIIPKMTHQKIAETLAERYPNAVIPMYGDIENFIILFQNTPTLLPGYYPRFKTIFNKFDKYSDKLGALERKFNWLQLTFSGVKNFETTKDDFIGNIIKDGSETKTYDTTNTGYAEVKNETNHKFDSVTQNADTPEIIPTETQDETIANFISMLSKYGGTNDYTGKNYKNKTDSKTGSISTLKEKEHNYLEMVENIKNEYYQILDEIVSGIAITFELE